MGNTQKEAKWYKKEKQRRDKEHNAGELKYYYLSSISIVCFNIICSIETDKLIATFKMAEKWFQQT